MSQHRSKAKGSAGSGMSDFYLDYNCNLTVRRAKSHSKARGSSSHRSKSDNE